MIIPLKQFKAVIFPILTMQVAPFIFTVKLQSEIKALNEKRRLVTCTLGNTNQLDIGWPLERLVSKVSWLANNLHLLNSQYFFWESTLSSLNICSGYFKAKYLFHKNVKKIPPRYEQE
tara:strand:- start:44417 stop:44770 length:354 start_codon:yes stop_codon:yes gene_type:complete